MPQIGTRSLVPPTSGASAGSRKKQFFHVKKGVERMRFERTGVVPSRSQEYQSLQEWYKNFVAEQKQRKTQQNDLDMSIARKQCREIARVFGGKTVGDHNVGILGFPTIWARGWTATDVHPQAPWPSPREFREEGDERHTSNYGRFLPIPRVPGNKTVVYKHKSWSTVEPFDTIMHVPKVCGMINTKMFGFYDTEVDANGVPYDDHDLPGDEYIIKNVVADAGSEQDSTTSRHHTILSSEPIRSMEHDFADFVLDSMVTPPTRKLKGSRIKATAAPFIPRNPVALRPESINKYQAGHVDNDDQRNDPTKKLANGTLQDSDRATQLHNLQTLSDTLGVASPWVMKNTLRGQLRVDTNVYKVQKDIENCTESTPASPTDFKYAMTPTVLGSKHQFSPGADTISYLSDPEDSPVYSEPTTFSSCQPRAKKPAPLKPVPSRRAQSVTSMAADNEDAEDGGVKLE